MSSNSSASHPYSPDDALPPVEPPNAGFILQLFVVPGVIVVVVVMIYLMFNYLAHMGNDRDAYVRDLSRNNEARWQAAFNLANALREEHNSGRLRLAKDPELAEQLAGILDREIESGSMDKEQLALRVFLCRALGYFNVSDGLPALVKAASTQRDEREADVRRAALEGIAQFADNVGGPSLGGGADRSDASPAADGKSAQPSAEIDKKVRESLRETLLGAAADPEARTRSTAAVALGVIGGDEFTNKLRFMLEDSSPDVRYNAAMRLAHLGDLAAVPMLKEMLDPNEQAGVEAEKEVKMRDFKRNLITLNALRASGQLAEKRRDADLGELRAAIEALQAGDISAETRIEAATALQHFAAPAAK